eukprot:CAMPEP_0197467428 /NCGR_PEP_ID=MMETSP1175-20131217/65562_1 /TAXON_ID=1003142 /ORGANISM="Triceratium dubium, Strain CCMP147" /LENGTH=121 /DNA_ID=CAMNT_0043003497 /DNA_START=265 /DNA_END=626 /DNA_ORIENTATION=-
MCWGVSGVPLPGPEEEGCQGENPTCDECDCSCQECCSPASIRAFFATVVLVVLAGYTFLTKLELQLKTKWMKQRLERALCDPSIVESCLIVEGNDAKEETVAETLDESNAGDPVDIELVSS